MRKEYIKTVVSFLILSTFFWTQFLWAYGLPLQNEVPSKPEEPVKNLPINIQEQFPKDSCKTSKITQILNRIDSENIIPEIIEKELTSSVKEPTGEVLKVAFLGNSAPQIPPQFYPSCGVFDRLGRITEKRGEIDGESYKYKVRAFDELGRAVGYDEKIGKVKYTHYAIQYDELGRITEEKIRVKASKGSGIFKSKTKVLTEYKYSYDIHGKRETTYEHEIYNKTSSNPIGKIVKIVVGIATAAFTFGQSIWITAAWMAVENFAFSMLSGADIGEALLSAAISYVATVAGAAIGGHLSGGAQGVTQALSSTFTGTLFERAGAFFQNFTAFDTLFQTLSLIDTFVVDDEGKGLFEQIFGEWGATVLSGISILGGLMTGGTGINGPPSTYQVFGAIGRLATLSILTALGDRINSNLKQFLSGFFSQMFVTYANQETAQKQRNKDIKEAGMDFDLDNWGNAINIRLPQAILSYANAKAQSITTGGLSTFLDVAEELSAFALQKEQKGFWTNLKRNLKNTLFITYDASGWDPVVTPDTYIFILPGIGNPLSELNSPPYSVNQVESINNETGEKIAVAVPLFETNLTPKIMGNVIGKLEDVYLWYLDKVYGMDKISNEIKSKLEVGFSHLSEEAKQKGITLQLYSGSFDTGLEALNKMTFPFKVTVVAVGGPSIFGSRYFFGGKITNPNIKNIVNVWGENDGFTNILGTVGPKNYTGTDVINIKILGIGHTDYLNNSNNPDPSSLSYKARAFVNEISVKSYNSVELYRFLNNPVINYDPNRELYIVDLNRLYSENRR